MKANRFILLLFASFMVAVAICILYMTLGLFLLGVEKISKYKDLLDIIFLGTMMLSFPLLYKYMK